MKHLKLTLFGFSILLFSCNKTKAELNAIQENQKNVIQNYDRTFADAGQLIADFPVYVQPDLKQKSDFGNDLIPWINILNAQKEIDRLQNPNQILVTQNTAKLIIDYPLNNPAVFEIQNPNGFSRMDLIHIISQKYTEIYKKKNTDYSIQEQNISDLNLSGIKVFLNNDNKITIALQIES